MPGAIAVLLVGSLRGLGLLAEAEWGAFDRLWRWRLPEPTDERVVVVRVTEEDLRRYGYPLPDGVLAAALTKLQAQNPRAIGVDIFRDLPVGTGGDRLAPLWRDERLVAIEKAVLPDPDNSRVPPPPGVPPHRVGFADVLPDRDGQVRRALLSAPGLDGHYRFSLATRLAERYLQVEGLPLTNGVRDPHAFRWGTVEVPRFRGDWGGYVRADDGGNQILMPWPKGPVLPGDMRFPSMTLHQLLTNRGLPATDRLVLIGYAAAASAKDTLRIPAVSETEIYGVEYHALVVSHLLTMVLDRRPPLRAFPGWLSELWWLGWGALGMTLALQGRSPLRLTLALTLALLGLGVGGWAALLVFWWVPVVPPALALLLAGIGTAYVRDFVALVAQQQQLLEQRQQTLDEAFNAMHNGPLHTLAEILGQVRRQETSPVLLLPKLETLDRELRQVYESLRPEAQSRYEAPLHELLYEVYHKTLQRDFPVFHELKLKIPDIHPIPETHLNGDRKRELCAFLEEALCNIGKHASGATRLKVICKEENGWCVIGAIDNGPGIDPNRPQRVSGGTKHAQMLARQLGGTFQREPHPPHGTRCEIRWPAKSSKIL